MSKLASDAIVKLAPPTKERPRCLCCGKRLRANYDVKTERRDYVLSAKEAQRRNAQNPDAAWLWNAGDTVYESRVVERIWRGTYGIDNRWCNTLCTIRWARAVCPLLEKEGSSWRCSEAIQRTQEEGE